VAKAMAVYLDFEKVEPRQLDDARLAIEVVCVERVAARISEDEAAEVRTFLTAEAARIASSGTQNLSDFHVLVARLTANPALHLFVRTLTDLTRRQQPVLDRNRLSPDDIHAAHVKIAEAIITRDGALARRRMMTHLEEVSATGPRRPPARLQRGEAHPAAGGEVLREEPAESVVS
jgi:DNA-binding FadR family transcriptional regulator